MAERTQELHGYRAAANLSNTVEGLPASHKIFGENLRSDHAGLKSHPKNIQSDTSVGALAKRSFDLQAISLKDAGLFHVLFASCLDGAECLLNGVSNARQTVFSRLAYRLGLFDTHCADFGLDLIA